MDALQKSHFSATAFDLEDDIDRAIAAITVENPTVVFNLVDHLGGDDTRLGQFVALLEMYEIEFTGSDALTLATCKDRLRTHLILQDANIPVPPFASVHNISKIPKCTELRYPFIVTQSFDDAYEEEGIQHLITTPEALHQRVDQVSVDFEMPLLIEEYLADRRIQAIVIGNEQLQVLPLVERSPNTLATAANMTTDQERLVNATACDAFRALGCQDWAQIDLI